MLVITNEIKSYILSVLLRDTSYIDIISYSDNVDLQTPVTIIPSEFFKVNFYATEKSIPTFPLQEWEGIPLLYGYPEVKLQNGRLIIYADIIASSFFLMSRYEEIIRPDNIDEHGRFIGSASIAGKGQFLGRPIIDEYGKKLREYLRKIGILINEPSTKGMIYLTHDIDLPWQRLGFIAAIRKIAAEIVKEHQWHIYPLLNSLNCFFINPYDTFSWLQQQDSSVKT